MGKGGKPHLQDAYIIKRSLIRHFVLINETVGATIPSLYRKARPSTCKKRILGVSPIALSKTYYHPQRASGKYFLTLVHVHMSVRLTT